MKSQTNPNIQLETLTSEIAMEDYLRDYVDVERFLGLCAQCSNYDSRWSCPPYDFDPLDYLKEFSAVRVVARRISPIGDWRFGEHAGQADPTDSTLDAEADSAAGPTYTGENAQSYDHVWRMLSQVKADLEEELFEMEKQFPGSRLLSGGSCYKCAEGCTRPAGEPCRHPEMMRYSIEALGGDVEKIAKDLLHSPLIWCGAGEFPPYYMLVGGLLVK